MHTAAARATSSSMTTPAAATRGLSQLEEVYAPAQALEYPGGFEALSAGLVLRAFAS